MYNNAIVGLIPYVDEDGVQHTLAVRFGVDFEGDFTLTIEADGNLITGLEMTESSGVYTITAGSLG